MHKYILLEKNKAFPLPAPILLSAPEVRTVIKVMCVPSDLFLFFFSKYIYRKDIVLSLPMCFMKKGIKLWIYTFLLCSVVYLGDILMPKHTARSPTACCLVFIVWECLF